MDPAMNADLMSCRGKRPLLVGIGERGHRRHVKGCADVMAGQQRGDARHAHPRAILAPGQPPDGFAAVAQLVGLVIGIERQREGASRAIRPAFWPERPAGPDLIQDGAPMLFGPLPGLKVLIRHDAFP